MELKMIDSEEEVQEKKVTWPKGEAKEVEEIYPVEKLGKMYDVPGWVLAGLKAAHKWGQGKKLTEKEFLQLRDEWLTGPMRRVK